MPFVLNVGSVLKDYVLKIRHASITLCTPMSRGSTHAMPPKYSESDVDRLQLSLDALNGRLADCKKDIISKNKQAKMAGTRVQRSMTRAARVIMCLPHGGLE